MNVAARERFVQIEAREMRIATTALNEQLVDFDSWQPVRRMVE